MKNKKYSKYKNKRLNNDQESDNDVPDGGFPPIYMCNSNKIISEEQNKNREYSVSKSAVSIKDILNKRRDATPLFVI
ncbi:hypothetical protein Catovirus_2_222 [Catovirus CTV1]|uniref:Uncharacterized protein n=1 Tax=Catovirus CTV1 TaxID=1977631 RepID=A0A1V0SC32_9VIRU|nr:hypothetical protein Catovirus_2_222 [Catovirus CTV1]